MPAALIEALSRECVDLRARLAEIEKIAEERLENSFLRHGGRSRNAFEKIRKIAEGDPQ